jgi:hypothetical protein
MLESLAKLFNVTVSFFYGNPNELSESVAEYYATANAFRLPILAGISLELPYYREEEVIGYVEFPRFLFPGAKIIATVSSDLALPEEDIKEGDCCVVAFETRQENSAIVLIKEKEKIRLKRVSNLKQYSADIIGQVIGILKKL